MEYNVHQISPDHNFCVKGVSYIGSPKPYTAMFVSKKVGNLLTNLKSISNCLVFAEKGLIVEPCMMASHCFVFSDNPQKDYARFANMLYRRWFKKQRERKYVYTQDGYYLGENVKIGTDVWIEPGCLIGHDVIIGDNSCILAGATIKASIVGDNFLANEGATIGTFGFNMADDEDGKKFRIPTLGKVRIGNYVEIGANCNISCGLSGDTFIGDYVKIDALTYVGHDVHIESNTEIAAGCIIGGFTQIEGNVYVGLNSSVRNRINLSENSIIGMGSTVTRSVEAKKIVVGNPAKEFNKKKV